MNTIFIIFATEYIYNGSFKELVQLSCLKISLSEKKKTIDILEQMNIFIKPEKNFNLTKKFIEDTGITTEILNIIGVDFKFFFLKFQEFCSNLNVYSYDNEIKILLDNLDYYKLYRPINFLNQFKTFQEIIKKTGVDTKKYNSGNIYEAFDIDIKKSKKTTRWSTISLYLTIKYIIKNYPLIHKF